MVDNLLAAPKLMEMPDILVGGRLLTHLPALKRPMGALCSADVPSCVISRAPYRAGSRIMRYGRSQEGPEGPPRGRIGPHMSAGKSGFLRPPIQKQLHYK